MDRAWFSFDLLQGKSHFVELAGNLVPVTKSGDQLSLRFYAFRENRLPFNVRVKDPNSEPLGRIAFTKEPKNNRQDSSSSSQAPQVSDNHRVHIGRSQ